MFAHIAKQWVKTSPWTLELRVESWWEMFDILWNCTKRLNGPHSVGLSLTSSMLHQWPFSDLNSIIWDFSPYTIITKGTAMKQPIHLSQQNPKMTLTISWKVLMLQGFTAHSLSQWLNKGFFTESRSICKFINWSWGSLWASVMYFCIRGGMCICFSVLYYSFKQNLGTLHPSNSCVIPVVYLSLLVTLKTGHHFNNLP